MDAITRFEAQREALAEFCRQNRIRKLSIFGSALREDFNEESDVDLLVEFEPGQSPGWAFYGMADDLRMIFGRPVDFLTEHGLNRHIRAKVLREAQPLYDAA